MESVIGNDCAEEATAEKSARLQLIVKFAYTLTHLKRFGLVHSTVLRLSLYVSSGGFSDLPPKTFWEHFTVHVPDP